jgi:serine protease inhibitor
MVSLDFRNRSAAARVINKWVNDLTSGNINAMVNPGNVNHSATQLVLDMNSAVLMHFC